MTQNTSHNLCIAQDTLSRISRARVQRPCVICDAAAVTGANTTTTSSPTMRKFFPLPPSGTYLPSN